MEWEYESNRDAYQYPCCLYSDRVQTLSEHPFSQMHLHYNIEIICVVEGAFELSLYDLSACRYRMTLNPGEFIMINSNILHNTVGGEKCRYYLAYIPPDCLMPQLALSVGETFSHPAADTNRQVTDLLRLMAERHQTIDPDENESVKAALMISLANAAAALMLPKLNDKQVKIRAVAEGEDVINYVYKHFRNPSLSVQQLSSAFGYSSDKLSDIFHDKFGVGVRQYITNLRINAAKTQLLTTADSNESVSRQVGFDSIRTYYRAFITSTGMTPAAFRALGVVNPASPDQKTEL